MLLLKLEATLPWPLFQSFKEMLPTVNTLSPQRGSTTDLFPQTTGVTESRGDANQSFLKSTVSASPVGRLVIAPLSCSECYVTSDT